MHTLNASSVPWEMLFEASLTLFVLSFTSDNDSRIWFVWSLWVTTSCVSVVTKSETSFICSIVFSKDFSTAWDDVAIPSISAWIA